MNTPKIKPNLCQIYDEVNGLVCIENWLFAYIGMLHFDVNTFYLRIFKLQ